MVDVVAVAAVVAVAVAVAVLVMFENFGHVHSCLFVFRVEAGGGFCKRNRVTMPHIILQLVL